MTNNHNHFSQYKDSTIERQDRQSDLSEFGFVAKCSLERQSRIDEFFPQETASNIFDSIFACLDEETRLEKAIKEVGSK